MKLGAVVVLALATMVVTLAAAGQRKDAILGPKK